MTIAAGTHLGPYEILSLLGAGGMGEVYRACDKRVDRAVALKVLPEEFFENEERRGRFEREARMLASLNHPGIAVLYSFEEIPSSSTSSTRHLLVMELVEGQTLADRLLKGPFPVEQLLKMGIEIASALDAAHRVGIVHRDLKPGNIMLTKSGAKLLDFGLAKAAGQPIRSTSATSLPTELPKNLTQQGTILGTLQYMSPEQLEGKDADPRSDLFAFGALLYEMATGRRAFEAKSQASLITAIMSSEPPPVSTIQPMTPPALDRVVRICLAKDPDERWQNAHDLMSELAWIAQGGSGVGIPAPVVAKRKSRERIAWSAAVAALLALAAVALFGRRASDHPRPVRLSLDAPTNAPFEHFDHAVLSPDGQTVAFIAHSAGGRQSLWIRSLESLSASPLAGTDGVSGLFWSPNSASIGFFAEGKLKRIEASGGAPRVLADADAPSGGAWNRDGVVLFSPNRYAVIHRVDANGGAVTPVTKLGPHEDGHLWPRFLSDGRHFVFLGDASATQDHSIRLGSLDSPDSLMLIAAAVSNLDFAPPDWLLFVRGGTLVAQRLDLRNSRVVGEPMPLGQQVAQIDLGHGFEFSASQSGVLLYRSATPELQLVWFDRAGKRLGSVGEPARYGHFEISPDERRVAFERLDADLRHGNLWLLDLGRGATSRLTSTASSDYGPVWSPDGKKILYGSAREGLADIYEIGAGGGAGEKLILHDAQDKFPLSWSPDGRSALVSVVARATRDDIWLLPLSEPGKAAPLVATRFAEVDAQVSPDGQQFAYSSDESGRFEVYVQPFGDASNRYRVSTSGGVRPRWRADGKELFFLSGSTLQSVVISGGDRLEAGPPRDLLRFPVWGDYAVTRDGRILAATSTEENPFQPMTVVLNWASGLRKP